jgi:hypothetical protein
MSAADSAHRRQLVRPALLLASWGAVVLFTASQYSLIYTATGGEAHWWMALRVSVFQWLPWVILGPLVVALARRLPLRGAPWPWHLAVHLLAMLAVVAIVITLAFALVALGAPPINRSFGAEYLRSLHSVAVVYWLIVAGTQVAGRSSVHASASDTSPDWRFSSPTLVSPRCRRSCIRIFCSTRCTR